MWVDMEIDVVGNNKIIAMHMTKPSINPEGVHKVEQD